jgi:hypothetical protein
MTEKKITPRPTKLKGINVAPWSTSSREIFTNTIDYGLESIRNLVSEKILDLNPIYQRRERWSTDRKSALIESFLMSVPIPPVFLNEDELGEMTVIDGKQRLLAIHNFLDNKLTLSGLTYYPELNGKTYKTLDSQIKSFLRTRSSIRAIIILNKSPQDIKYEVFHRLNQGIALNAQEVRNNAFAGPLNDLINDLSINPLLHQMLLVKNRNTDSTYLQMKDSELVLRFFTFKDSWKSVARRLNEGLDAYMDQNSSASKTMINQLQSHFLETLNNVYSCFGENAFKRWMPKTSVWRNQALVTIYDAQMIACYKQKLKPTINQKIQFTEKFQELCSTPDFDKYFRTDTTTPLYLRKRVELVRTIIGDVL